MKNYGFIFTLSRIFITLIFIAAAGGAVALYDRTLINPAIPVALGLLVALLSLKSCLNRWAIFTTISSRWITIPCHLFAATAVTAFAILALNYFFPKNGTEHRQDVTVTSKYTKKHNRYRRLSHGRSTISGHYNSYHATVVFPDGQTKEIVLSAGQYRNTRVNATITYSMATGLLGFPVFH